MRRLNTLLAATVLFMCCFIPAGADNGFSIRGGILHDTPSDKPYKDLTSGFGYIGSLGYDFIDAAGFEVGVMHSTHDFYLGVISNVVIEDKAEKTTFFIKGRVVPWKYKKTELALGAGPAFFDISGKRLYGPSSGQRFDEGFSGWGYLLNLDLRTYLGDHLAGTFYLSANFIGYSKYSILNLDTAYNGKLPGGDSISWGLTLFYRIGKP